MPYPPAPDEINYPHLRAIDTTLHCHIGESYSRDLTAYPVAPGTYQMVTAAQIEAIKADAETRGANSMIAYREAEIAVLRAQVASMDALITEARAEGRQEAYDDCPKPIDVTDGARIRSAVMDHACADLCAADIDLRRAEDAVIKAAVMPRAPDPPYVVPRDLWIRLADGIDDLIEVQTAIEMANVVPERDGV